MNVQIIHLYTVHVTQWERRQNECDSNIYMKWEIHCWGARARIPLEDSNSGGDATSGDFHTLWFGTDFVLFFYFWFTVYRVSKWISNCFFFAPVLLMCLALFWRDRPNEEMLRSEIRSVLILNNNVGAPSLPGAKWKLFGYRIIWWFGILYIHLLVCTVKWSPLARIFQFSLDVSSFVVGSVGLLYAFHPRYSPPRRTDVRILCAFVGFFYFFITANDNHVLISIIIIASLLCVCILQQHLAVQPQENGKSLWQIVISSSIHNLRFEKSA